MSKDEYSELDELDPAFKKKKSKHQKLLDEVRLIDDESSQSQTTFLASSVLADKSAKDEEKEVKRKKNLVFTDDEDDEWLSAIMSIKLEKSRRHSRDELFESAGLKKKKKKKKKKGELTDYNKEFETEAALIRNLLQDQSRFTDSLQQEYDKMKSSKSSARGVNKAITDLIENINSARSLSMQLVEKNIHLKKLVAELTMKEKKELGISDGENDMNNFAASYLSKMINERGNLLNGTGVPEVGEFTDDEIMATLAEGLVDSERSEDVEKYLMYENRNITTYISVNNNDIEDFNFISKDEDGEIIEDYPTPQVSSISVNRSTNIATDNFGKKYPILWR